MENKKQAIKSPKSAYMGYLFQTFLKRPFGYIVAVLYIVYLAVILLIVPKAMDVNPLFVWTIGGFNMPMFNLFFIAGAAASIAVAVFRTGRDDGFDLNMSAKPFTKGTTVLLKTLVYLLIMLIINAITIIIVTLILPVFGQYQANVNETGITIAKYQGMLVSVFVGNLINMLFFGGISVFISMVGGQVITIIGTIASVFVLFLMNFLYPQILKSSLEVLSDKYDTSISSYTSNTLEQYNDPNMDQTPYNFATIQCITNDDGVEEYHYDTYDYWLKAEREAGRKTANYIDIGKQLSGLYSIYGIDDTRVDEVSKLGIGTNNSFNYIIDSSTHVGKAGNVALKKYPISHYTMSHSQGKMFPIVRFIGGDLDVSLTHLQNWYVRSMLNYVNFNSVIVASETQDGMDISDWMFELYEKPWQTMEMLHISAAQQEAAKALYYEAREKYIEDEEKEPNFAEITYWVIKADKSGQFFEPGSYDDLDFKTHFAIASKIHLYWTTIAQQDQIDQIVDYWHHQNVDVSFPFKSKEVTEWYQKAVQEKDPEFDYSEETKFENAVFSRGILVDIDHVRDRFAHTHLVTSSCNYAETLSNMYTYSVKPFYNNTLIISIWTTISICLFAGAVLVYRKTDFK